MGVNNAERQIPKNFSPAYKTVKINIRNFFIN